MTWEDYSHNHFDFGAWLRFDPATITKSKFRISNQSLVIPSYLTGATPPISAGDFLAQLDRVSRQIS
jgi:hypothetical protein